jgi:hypothetical protein
MLSLRNPGDLGQPAIVRDARQIDAARRDGPAGRGGEAKQQR